MAAYSDSLIGFNTATLSNPAGIDISGGPVLTVGTTSTYSKIQRVNLHPNPKAGISTAYMQGGTAGTGTGSFTRVATAGPIAAINSLFQTAVATGTLTSMDVSNSTTSLIPINAKANYNFSAYVKSNGATTSTVAHYISWYAGDGTSLISTLSQTGIAATNGAWQRIEFASPTVPSNAYYCIYMIRAFSSSTFAVGNNIQVTGFLIEGS